MAHPLNTNKQFMLCNGILAFAVIFVVVIFSYMSLSLQRKNESTSYPESYTLTLNDSFLNDSVAIYINDSLLFEGKPNSYPLSVTVNRFAEQNVAILVNQKTDRLFMFDLKQEGGEYHFNLQNNEISRIK